MSVAAKTTCAAAVLAVVVVVALAADSGLATSKPKPFDPPQQASDSPQQVHIALGNTEGTAMVVSWITSQTKEGMVLFGRSKTGLSNSAAQLATPERYHFQSAYGENYTSGLIHHAKLEHLEPSTVYYYRCGVDQYGFSTVFSFTTPPKLGAKSLVMNVIGDLGQTINSVSTLKHIQLDSNAHMTVLVGDLSYADSAERSTILRNCTQRRWDSWGDVIQPVYANQPLMVLPGNHEIEQEGPPPATQTRFLAYRKRFRMPAPESGATHGNLYYSFQAGPVHFIMLNSYMNFTAGSDQYEWLMRDLRTVDRSMTPWLFVGMHAPWYNSNFHHHNEPEETGMRAAMEPLMHKHNVDAIFSGHVHAYERIYPVYKNKTDPSATSYLNIGDGGNREGPAFGYYPQPSWSAYREPSFGHGRLEIFNNTHAHWTWHKNLNSEPTVSDDVWLVRHSAIKGSPYHSGLAHLHARTFDGFAPFKTF